MSRQWVARPEPAVFLPVPASWGPKARVARCRSFAKATNARLCGAAAQSARASVAHRVLVRATAQRASPALATRRRVAVSRTAAVERPTRAVPRISVGRALSWEPRTRWCLSAFRPRSAHWPSRFRVLKAAVAVAAAIEPAWSYVPTGRRLAPFPAKAQTVTRARETSPERARTATSARRARGASNSAIPSAASRAAIRVTAARRLRVSPPTWECVSLMSMATPLPSEFADSFWAT